MAHRDTAHALVSTEWLHDHLDDPTVRVVEIDEDTDAYAAGHVPGAVTWNWYRDLQHPLRRDYVDREQLGALLSRSGVGPGTTVIVYGGNNNWFAAYGYWLLKYRGFEAVRLLDGGRMKWEAEGRPLTKEVPAPEPTGFRLTASARPGLRAYREDVLRGLGSVAFVDVRSPEEFTGEKLARNYDGSWTEYGSSVGVPVER